MTTLVINRQAHQQKINLNAAMVRAAAGLEPCSIGGFSSMPRIIASTCVITTHNPLPLTYLGSY